MPIPTQEQILRQYLYNSTSSSVNLIDPSLIRGKAYNGDVAVTKGSPLDVDMADYMSAGGGRFAKMSMSSLVQNFFNAPGHAKPTSRLISTPVNSLSFLNLPCSALTRTIKNGLEESFTSLKMT